MTEHTFMKQSETITLTRFEFMSKMSTMLTPLLALNGCLILHLGSSQLIIAKRMEKKLLGCYKDMGTNGRK